MELKRKFCLWFLYMLPLDGSRMLWSLWIIRRSHDLHTENIHNFSHWEPMNTALSFNMEQKQDIGVIKKINIHFTLEKTLDWNPGELGSTFLSFSGAARYSRSKLLFLTPYNSPVAQWIYRGGQCQALQCWMETHTIRQHPLPLPLLDPSSPFCALSHPVPPPHQLPPSKKGSSCHLASWYFLYSLLVLLPCNLLMLRPNADWCWPLCWCWVSPASALRHFCNTQHRRSSWRARCCGWEGLGCQRPCLHKHRRDRDKH